MATEGTMIGSTLDTAVIVCTYRRSDLLDRAVRRVFAQEGYERQFVVVVNDGSADEGRTDAVLAVLERDFSDRLVVVRHDQNYGVATARTTGVKVAIEQGASMICFHDDDDFWPPNRLALGAGPFQDPTTALTYGVQHRVDDSVHHTGDITVVWSYPSVGYRRTIFDGLMRGRVYLPFQTMMLQAELCSRLLPFEPVRESEDVDFALKAMALIHRTPNLRAVYVPQVLAYYVTSPDSLSQTDENNRIREGVHRAILAEHVPRPLVDVMFAFSNRILRPVGVRLGKARKRERPTG
jgi:glycosyltransferase involved in cell wall biosynthesis